MDKKSTVNKTEMVALSDEARVKEVLVQSVLGLEEAIEIIRKHHKS